MVDGSWKVVGGECGMGVRDVRQPNPMCVRYYRCERVEVYGRISARRRRISSIAIIKTKKKVREPQAAHGRWSVCSVFRVIFNSLTHSLISILFGLPQGHCEKARDINNCYHKNKKCGSRNRPMAAGVLVALFAQYWTKLRHALSYPTALTFAPPTSHM